ncbi:recombinase family protein [Methylobacterium sp. P31]
MRVSTKRQGDSGLGLEAQHAAVETYLNGGDWTVCGEFVEVESGKSNANRPQLQRAIQACRVYEAKLLIAKFDRLSRDAHLLSGLEKAGIEFVATDNAHANRFTVGIMARVADEERRAISARTTAALARKREFYAKLTDEQRDELKAAGKATQLGGDRGAVVSDEARAKRVEAHVARAYGRAADLSPILAEIQAAGASSLREIAAALNARVVPKARGGSWSAVQVQQVMQRTA